MPLPAAPIIVYVATASGCLTTGVSSCLSSCAAWRSANTAVQTLELNIDKTKVCNVLDTFNEN
jgi:hypothetical protein